MTSPIVANVRSFLLPFAAAVLVPWVLLGGSLSFDRIDSANAVVGSLLIVGGLGMLVWTISLFIRVGRGTLAPWDPTRKLVVVGPYAHVRNPMISGVFCVICGEAIALRSVAIGLWAAAFFVINHAYFVVFEEPGLVKRFGDEYEEYRRHVPRWSSGRQPKGTPRPFGGSAG
jgi:protein-S-isoprenylcysteine O-methyltransferase Ste14